MADISQLEVNGTTYDICDATARDSLSQYLPLSGGHMTGGVTFDSGGITIANSGMTVKTGLVVSDGNLYTNSPEVDRNGAAPSTDQVRGVYLRDKDSEALGVFQSIYRGTNGRSEAGIYAYNSANGEATGSSTQGYIKVQVDKDGTQSYALSAPAAFRKAISGIWPLYPDVTRGTTPSTTIYHEGIQWYDNQNSPKRLGFIRFNSLSTGINQMQITACNSSGSTEYANSIILGVTAAGVKSYSITDPSAFCDAIGLGGVGTMYSASWTATSASANNAVLTGNITLPAGTYVITMMIPYISAGTATVKLVNSSNTIIENNFFSPGGSNTAKTTIHKFTASTTLRICSATTNSLTFTNPERGGLKAVRII